MVNDLLDVLPLVRPVHESRELLATETMSAIGPGNIGALNIAGSFAGAQRTEAEADRTKEAAAGRKFKIDQQAMSAHGSDDVAETDLSADRDADGHYLPGERTDQQTADDRSADNAKQQADRIRRAADANGERGTTLDLNA